MWSAVVKESVPGKHNSFGALIYREVALKIATEEQLEFK